MFHDIQRLISEAPGQFGRVLHSAGVWIALMPVFFHAIDKAMERTPPFGEARMRQFMRNSPQTPVSELARNDDSLKAMMAYFDFEKACHLVISLTLFDALAVYAAEVECTGSFLQVRPVAFFLILFLLAALLIFLVLLRNGAFPPEQARPRATRGWERFAKRALVVVLFYDAWLRITCHSAG
jgi:hypothetical protein